MIFRFIRWLFRMKTVVYWKRNGEWVERDS